MKLRKTPNLELKRPKMFMVLTTSVIFMLIPNSISSKINEDTKPLANIDDLAMESIQLKPEDRVAGFNESAQDSKGTEIVLSSIDPNEVLNQQSGNRHRYEQTSSTSTTEASQFLIQQTTLATLSPIASKANDSTMSLKPEARQEDDQQLQDPEILDHRPQGLGNHQDPQAATTQSPPLSQSTLSPSQVPAAQTQPNGATGGSSTSWVSSQALNSNNQPQSQNFYSQHQATGTSASSSMVVQPSNQIFTVQHPTSINSIINEQQNQGANQQVNQITGAQMSPLTGQQSAPVIFMSTNGAIGAKRISLSNWLRGLSNMLANIFNRRDHGTTGLLAQSPGHQGHWIQLGPNTPHWLSQAQGAIQQYQQQQVGLTGGQLAAHPMAASSNRYAFVMAPNQVNAPMQSMSTIQTQPQQQQTAPTNFVQNNIDLQPSPSAGHATIVQAPVQSHQYQLVPIANSQSQSIGQTSAQIQIQPQRQATTATIPQQVKSSSPSIATVQLHPTSNSNQQQQTLTRVGRSSGRATSSSTSDQNLPLAHYSRLADS